MATSGSYAANNLGNGRYIFVNWQLAGQEIGNNRSLINWQAYAHFTNSDNQLDNGYVNTNVGQVWANGGRVKNFTGVVSGDRNVGLASGSFWVNHNSVGNGQVQFGVGLSYYGTGRSEGTSGVWDLTTIPRNATITGGSTAFNDEQNPTINYSNPAGNAVDILAAGIWKPDGATTATGYINISKTASSYTFALTSDQRETLRSWLANTSSMTVRVYLRSQIGSSDSRPWRDMTLSIVNGNPTFTDFTYKDTNAATVAVTGNDQMIIQSKSTVRATISTANKMVAIKSATAVSYIGSLDGTVATQPYSAVAAVDIDLGSVVASGTKTLMVNAKDSRSTQVAVSKNIDVIPYELPVINATATRQNNFEAATTVKISGVFSRLTVSGTDKNAITTGSLQYRLRQDGGAWSSWVVKTFTGGVGTFSTTDTILSLVNSSQYDIEIMVSDKLETVTRSVSVDRGVPLFMVSDNLQAIGINKMPASGRALDVAGDIYTNNEKVLTRSNLGNSWGILNFSAPTTGQVMGVGTTTIGYTNLLASTDGVITKNGSTLQVSEAGLYLMTANVRCIDVPRPSLHSVFVTPPSGSEVCVAYWHNRQTPESTARQFPPHSLILYLDAGARVTHKIDVADGATRIGGASATSTGTSLSLNKLA